MERVRRGLSLHWNDVAEPPIREIAFTTRTGPELQGWCGLKDTIAKRAIGEDSHCKHSSRSDPVGAYLIAKLWSSTYQEAGNVKTSPGEFLFFSEGRPFGGIIEFDSPKSFRFWQSLWGGERQGGIQSFVKVVGKFGFTYPMNNKTT